MMALLNNRQLFRFGAQLSELRLWEAVPILLADADAGGPCERGFFEFLLGELKTRLAASAPLDAVYIQGHGAGLTHDLQDLDGAYFRVVRELVGKDAPIVATLDLHANISDAMVEAADVLIGYRTNPHVDVQERGAEAALLLNDLLNGMQPSVALVRLPMITPQVAQLTAPNEPLGEFMKDCEMAMRGPVANVSAFPGFAFGDSKFNGFSVVVTSRDGAGPALEEACHLASAAWRDRARYTRTVLSLDEALQVALDARPTDGGRLKILADVADNPGGGGRGNTTWLLEAMVRESAVGVQLAPFFDPPLAAEAWRVGVGGEFLAHFNRDEHSAFSRPFRAMARVKALSRGAFTGRYGMIVGRAVDLGLCAALEVGGVDVAVASVREQLWGPDVLEHMGLDVRMAKVVVAKSRGHFRAGFAHIASDQDIYEFAAPGLTTPDLASVQWERLVRPCYPLDADASWADYVPVLRLKSASHERLVEVKA